MGDSAITIVEGPQPLPPWHRHDGPVLDLYPAFDAPPSDPPASQATATQRHRAATTDALRRRQWLPRVVVFVMITATAMAVALAVMLQDQGGSAASQIADPEAVAETIAPRPHEAGAPGIRGPVVDPLSPHIAVADLTTVRVYSGGALALVVGGSVINGTGRTAAIPAITVAILDANGESLTTMRLLPARSALAPGATTRFDTEIAQFPSSGTTLAVAIGTEPPVIFAID